MKMAVKILSAFSTTVDGNHLSVQPGDILTLNEHWAAHYVETGQAEYHKPAKKKVNKPTPAPEVSAGEPLAETLLTGEKDNG